MTHRFRWPEVLDELPIEDCPQRHPRRSMYLANPIELKHKHPVFPEVAVSCNEPELPDTKTRVTVSVVTESAMAPSSSCDLKGYKAFCDSVLIISPVVCCRQETIGIPHVWIASKDIYQRCPSKCFLRFLAVSSLAMQLVTFCLGRLRSKWC